MVCGLFPEVIIWFLFACFFIISKWIVLAGFLTTSLVSLFLPNKEVNHAHFGQGNAGAGFPAVPECRPERGQEHRLATRDLPFPHLSHVKWLTCATELGLSAVDQQGDNPLVPGQGCQCGMSPVPDVAPRLGPQNTIFTLPGLMTSPRASKLRLQFNA